VLSALSVILLFVIPFMRSRVGLVAVVPLLVFVWIGRGFFRGVMNGLRPGACEMDIRVEQNGLGYLMGGERYWVFLDGIRRIEQIRRGLWTIAHFNGAVIHIPTESIFHAQLAHLYAAAERDKTPEGVQAVIERGRLMQAMREREGRRPDV
jgi:hypothetical protein